MRRRPSWPGRLGGRLWTGPAGHLLGGTLDVIGALARHLLVRARARVARRGAARPR